MNKLKNLRIISIDACFNGISKLSTGIILLLISSILLALVIYSLPSITAFKFNFLIDKAWNPVTGHFGAIGPLSGTLITSIIACIIGVPISFGVAVFLVQFVPLKLKRTLASAIELMAGIPSIVYGIWGLLFLAPIMATYVEPQLARLFSPIFPSLVEGPFLGISLLTAGLLLALMIVPFCAAMLYDLIIHVPKNTIESAYGTGLNWVEVMFRVILPKIRAGAIGSIMLGLGRALGETMAVTFVIGNAHNFTLNLLKPGGSISSVIANEFAEATTPLHIASLLNLGLILFLITFIIFSCARLILDRYET